MEKTLITSISGIRGIFGAGLDPGVLVRYAAAFGTWVRERREARGRKPVVVVGRDARVTGEACAHLVIATLQSTGCDVVDAGLATTPTVEVAVLAEGAAAGIVLSASHNSAEWNALKLLDERGEFLSHDDGTHVMRMADAGAFPFVRYDALGNRRNGDFLPEHLDRILALDFVDPEHIVRRDFRVVVDGVNSVGGIAIPALLERLGVRPQQIVRLHCEPTGRFAHVPEPLPGHLTELTRRVADEGADLGIAVDPDVDRLALVADGGHFVSEELTQVLAADFLWRFRPGPFATNLSSSRAIDDVAARHGCTVHRSAVGERNVVEKMRAVGAVLGGEGNGGVILPDLHYGRDALVGVALILQHLANLKAALSEVVDDLPQYAISKTKVAIGDRDPGGLLEAMARTYSGERIDTTDGLKIDFDDGWVHLRKSNTEPILRIYAEAATADAAAALTSRFAEALAALQTENDRR